MVVIQVEKDVVVNKVGKPEVKPRIVAFIRSLRVGGGVVFEPAKGFVFEPAKRFLFEPANEKNVSQSTGRR
jgi:hypothetical protein